MERKFEIMISQVAAKYEQLQKSILFNLKRIPRDLPKKGVYLFSENNRVLYVGRSNNIKQRLRNHIADSHFKATFAFLLAREESNFLRPSYKQKNSRENLLQNRVFRRCFDKARTSIREMKVRVVEETDATKQALLEIYATVATSAKYSTFDNH